jgi:hypothetical protein
MVFAVSEGQQVRHKGSGSRYNYADQNDLGSRDVMLVVKRRGYVNN